MPKRPAEEEPSGFDLSQASIKGVKSRSGRIVKPKIYNDGTVALLGSNAIDTVLDEEDQSNKTATHHITPTHALAHSEEDGVSDSDAAASSDASYGLRGGRSSARSEGGGRPQRRAAAAVRASRASTAAAAGGGGGSGGGIFKAAAIKILRQELRLMSTGEIARLALKHGLIRCTGKTPEATMASALYTDVKRREELSVFFRPQEGLFGLREWAVKDEEEPSGVPAGCDFHHQEDHAAVAAAAVNQALRAADEAAATTHRVTHDNNNNDNNNPHTGSDAVDRLMELLCAAEEINRASAEEEEEEDMAAHPEKDRMEEEGKVQAQSQYDMAAANEGRSFTTQPFDLPPSAKDVCATTRQGFGPSSTTAESIAAEAVRAAEAAMDRLKKELGAGHPEVSRGYLTLARIYTADMPVATRELAEGTILRAEAVVSECHSALGCHVAASPATLSLLVHRLQQQVEEMAALPSPLADESDGSARSRSRLQQLQTAIRTASVIATTALQAASAAAVHSAGGTCKQETPFMARRQCSSSSNEENIPITTTATHIVPGADVAATVPLPTARTPSSGTDGADGTTTVAHGGGCGASASAAALPTPEPVIAVPHLAPRNAVAPPRDLCVGSFEQPGRTCIAPFMPPVPPHRLAAHI